MSAIESLSQSEKMARDKASHRIAKKKANERLWLAIEAEDIDAMGEALACGADSNAPGESSSGMPWGAPLMYAAACGRADICAWLALRGAKVNLATLMGSTALHYAAGNKNLECVKALLKLGAKVEAADRSGQKAMHGAARSSVDCVRELASWGARLNDVENVYGSPLHHAAVFGNVESCRALFELGANPRVKNRNGETPMELARARTKTLVGLMSAQEREACAATLEALIEAKAIDSELPKRLRARGAKKAL